MIRKAPGGRAAAWHQDHAYWQPEFDYYALGVWLPMHDVSVEMGAMQFIPGSHKLGLLRHRQDDAPTENVLQVDEPVDFSKATPCPLKAGGATFHHSETLHYTAPNTTDKPRLAFPMEFQLAPVRRKASSRCRGSTSIGRRSAAPAHRSTSPTGCADDLPLIRLGRPTACPP